MGKVAERERACGKCIILNAMSSTKEWELLMKDQKLEVKDF